MGHDWLTFEMKMLLWSMDEMDWETRERFPSVNCRCLDAYVLCYVAAYVSITLCFSAQNTATVLHLLLWSEGLVTQRESSVFVVSFCSLSQCIVGTSQ